MINGPNFFDHPVKNNFRTYVNIRKIATGQEDDYTTDIFWIIPISSCCKMIAIDLSKQQEPDADPKPIQQFNFTRNLDRPGSTKIFSIIEEAKETVLDFSQGTVKVL